MNNQTIEFDDNITRLFLWATLIWGAVGMLVGVVIAVQLAWWPANGGIPWITYGRIRPVHTDAVIFAFAGNAFFTGLYYSLQRLVKARMWSDQLSKIHFWGWQLIIVSVAITLPLGITQGKEYAEMEWPIDIAVAVIWVLFTVNVMGTLAVRRVKHLYVAIWFYLASVITIALLHVVNALAIPVTFLKSYSVYAGVQDALVQWWYGHNAVGFLLTTTFLGLMYYFIPKAVNRPVYSYRLSIIHFWALVFIYIWAGPHHLLYTALPEWAQSLGMVFSIMLIAPSWGGMINGLLTMRGAWDRVRDDPVLKFFVLALTFYGMATLEGSLLSIKSLNLLSHYTDWTIAHVHSGALGWVGGMVFAMTYFLAPRLWDTKLYSVRMANAHFWLATLGILLYISSMWTSGIVQGLMLQDETKEGLLRYPNFIETVLAVLPLYWIRALGGLLYLVGAVLCLYNVFKTATQADARPVNDTTTAMVEEEKAPSTFHERLENKALPFAALMAVAVLVGGIVEFVPAFMVESNVPSISTVRPYTPLELEGRDVYLKEGCYTCHSQMIRTVANEENRYGPYSRPGEFVYDHPHQWGSKRTGPDLARQGGKYPDLWHYRHLMDPRSTSPGSIMPAYPWLEDTMVDTDDLPLKLRAMKSLGVPYSKQEISGALDLYLEQARAVQDRLAADGIKLDARSEMIAMIAYLQRLGIDYKMQSAATGAVRTEEGP